MKINNLYVLELNSEVTLSPVSFIIIYNSYCPVNWAFLEGLNGVVAFTVNG